jgi:hypothetical protein
MNHDDAAKFVDAQAALTGLQLAPEHRAGTVFNMALIATIAKAVMDFPLPPETEPAPVFTARDDERG